MTTSGVHRRRPWWRRPQRKHLARRYVIRARIVGGGMGLSLLLGAAGLTSLVVGGAPATATATPPVDAQVAGASTVPGPTTEPPAVAASATESLAAAGAAAGSEVAAVSSSPRRATIVVTGDVLIHGGVARRAAADAAAAGRSGYDFGPMLAPISSRVSAASLAICHLEVPLSATNDDLRGYPMFRAPRELAAGLVATGYDGCSVSSNHALDGGSRGVATTLDVMDGAGLRHTGTARSAEEAAQPVIYDAAGIRVGHLSYSYGFNGFKVPAGEPWWANEIDPDRIVADATALRGAGAEVVVVSLHWGNEYRHGPTPYQREVAERIAFTGAVDVIVGHHAHVVQPVTKIGGTWVIYGLGNLLSANSTPCCRQQTADGLLVTVELADGADGVAVADVSFAPTYNERRTFRVIPAADGVDFLEPGDALAAELRRSWDRTVGEVLAIDGAALGVEPDRSPPP